MTDGGKKQTCWDRAQPARYRLVHFPRKVVVITLPELLE